MAKTPSLKHPSKLCANCGRTIEYRKKWARAWDAVKYCGEKCRRNRQAPDYGPAILALLAERGPGKTICPSEVLVAEDKSDKEMMEQVRRSARRLANEGAIEITQQGKRVEPRDFRGPIRLRLIGKR